MALCHFCDGLLTCLVESKRFLIILSKHICKQLFDLRFLNKLRMKIEKKKQTLRDVLIITVLKIFPNNFLKIFTITHNNIDIIISQWLELLCEKGPNKEFFMVHIFPFLD